MIDLHCHLHFGVDDGPANEAQSLALARALVAAGVTTAACTSHVRADKAWMNVADGVRERHARLGAVLAAGNVPLQHVQGAEHYIDDHVFGDLDRFATLAVPYGSSRWLLVETPYLGQPPRLFDLLHALRVRGWRVLLAHAERFPYLSDNLEVAQRLVEAGHMIQVNLGSLAGAYNKAQQKNAERLLKADLVAVLAGDCHREDDVEANIVRGRAAAKKIVRDAGVERLTVTNPGLILADASPDRLWP